MSAGSPPIVLTPGDPRGIGLEITHKAWRRLRADGCTFVLAAPLAWLSRYSGPEQAVFRPIVNLDQASAVFPGALPVLDIPASARSDQAVVLQTIEIAAQLAQSGQASAVVTNPIHKKSLYDAGFDCPGHTEYLGRLTGSERPVMMLAIEGLRVVPVTVHASVAGAVKALSAEKIVHAARIAARELADKFGVAQPRLAVAALNPHAGEDGALGREEIEIIGPAIAQLQAEGHDVFGPAPVDTLFHPSARRRYDVAICMLHDHALLPLKTLDFERGVNVTLGLPIIRTSPDHGTAFDIAGRGIANPESLIAAIRLAADLVAKRYR